MHISKKKKNVTNSGVYGIQQSSIFNTFKMYILRVKPWPV